MQILLNEEPSFSELWNQFDHGELLVGLFTLGLVVVFLIGIGCLMGWLIAYAGLPKIGVAIATAWATIMIMQLRR